MTGPEPVEPIEADLTVVFEDRDLTSHGPGTLGYLSAVWDEQGPGFAVAVEATATVEDRREFQDFVGERIYRFLQYGPATDGWYDEGGGRWHLWCRMVAGPDMTFLVAPDATDPA